MVLMVLPVASRSGALSVWLQRTRNELCCSCAAAPGSGCCQVLAKVEEANQVGRKLPPDGFYNQLIRCGQALAAVAAAAAHSTEAFIHQ